MKAIIKEAPAENNKDLAPVMEKMEIIKSYHVVVTKTVKGEYDDRHIPHELIKLKVHGGRAKSAQRVYTSAVLTDICDLQTKGYGRDIGLTSAVSEALKGTGVELSENLALLDPCMIAHALMAVAEALGHNEYLIIED